MGSNKYEETLGSTILALDILEVIVGIIAILVNTLAIYILVYKLKLKQCDTVQSFIVSLFDIIYSFFTVINCILLWSTNHSLIMEGFYKQLTGYLFFCLGGCVMDSVTILSIIRYLAIYKQVKLSNVVWVSLTVALSVFNFVLSLSPLMQSQFKLQSSLKYSSIEFDMNENWSNNFYYCLIWIKLSIEVSIIMMSYFFISLYYYDYLKDYSNNNELVSSGEDDYGKLPKINLRESEGIQSDTGPIIQDDFEVQRIQRNRRLSSPVTDTPSEFQNSYSINTLIRNALSKLYIMLIVYMLELIPFFLIQAIFKPLNLPVNPIFDSIASLLTHLIPITNPCFVLFFHFETYQELVTILTLFYYKYF